MKPTVIVVNGYPESGKDTFCDFADDGYNCVHYSTVDTVKEVATKMGWDGSKNPTNRAMLSDLKDFYVRWFDGTFNEIVDIIMYESSSLNETDFIFIHSREPVEIDRICKWCNLGNIRCYSLCITRDDVKDKEKSNHADKNVDNYAYDVYIGNNESIETFRGLAVDFFEDVKNNNMEKYINMR